MQFRLANIDDINPLVDLLCILFAQEHEFTPNPQAQATALKKIINHPNIGQIMLASKNGTITGMVSLLYTFSTALGGKVCLLEDLVVAPQLRNQQIGTQLINYAIDTAKAAGCRRITLLTDSDNLAGQRFYQRCGFTPSSMQPMRLLLNL